VTAGKLTVPLFLLVLALGVVLAGAGVVLSVCLGARDIVLADIIAGVFSADKVGTEQLIIWDTRLPRALSALLIGAFLSVAGALMQGITRNPIASPSIMGVNQGAVLAVAVFTALSTLGLFTAGQGVEPEAVQGAVQSATQGATQAAAQEAVPLWGTLFGRTIFAFIGASCAALLVFVFSMRRTGVDITRLLLAGTALGMLFSALSSLIALLTNNTKNLTVWMAGGLSGASWEAFMVLLAFAVVLLVAFALSPRINILGLGDEAAIGLGQRPALIRFGALACVVLLSGTAAAVAGNIGFVCLIVPHIARLLVGSDYRRVIPFCMVAGAVLLSYSDTLARLLNSPFEVPIGTITSLIGVPILIYLVRKERRA
jgi:iron complex transport system permease protein